jgi:uncharacterized protein YukE
MNPEVEEKAKACEQHAGRLEQLQRDLITLRGQVKEGWTGRYGESLCEWLEAHAENVRTARDRLRTAAGQMRAAKLTKAGP